MNSHFWFRSGNYSLLGHLDCPRQSRNLGVIIVAPFGWEDVCAYRPLRFMAQTFAALGLFTLRYDLPGTGDSSGGAQDPGLFESWIGSVGDAAAELRRMTGVEDAAAVGIHLGGTLALASSARSDHLQYLVLWGAAARGRSILRELRAAANVEKIEYLAGPGAPPQPLPGLESGGFLLSPESVSALEGWDASRLRPRCRRALLLSRDDLPHDAHLAAALQNSFPVELAHGRGYSAMLAQPQEAAFPRETSLRIADFLTRDLSGAAAPRGVREAPRSVAVGESAESVWTVKHSGSEMFGILSAPRREPDAADPCLLFLNAGGVRHIGPNRMWLESARRWSARGVRSFRLDLLGIGESGGDECLDIPALYRECLMEQIASAMEALRRQAGIRRFVPIGLCAGACWGFHAALRDPDVCGAILLNPSLLYWDPSIDRRRMVKLFATGFNAWTGYGKMILGGLQPGEIRRGARRVVERLRRKRARPGSHLELGFESVAQAWSALERAEKRVTLVFREGEALLSELESASQLPPRGSVFLRCIRVPNGGHTFRPLWAQELVHGIMDGEIAALLSAVPHVPATA
ncbi:MAG TPA: hypothetical protein VKX39_15630 [Bryobacteraceae bacterium]|jgi:pimeloyl-ACP methyl ester carboxylesterase|nr:hypothetical protein [Bryobacteraceae bacterium]